MADTLRALRQMVFRVLGVAAMIAVVVFCFMLYEVSIRVVKWVE